MGFTFLVGGARSGKSRVAAELAGRSGLPVTVIATAAPRDDEMATRIEAHRLQRPQHWEVVEEEMELGAVIGSVAPDHYLIVDCLTLWVSNLLGTGRPIADEAEHAAGLMSTRAGVVVSNEVGSGIVPVNEVARRYRDELGRVNATFATHAAERFLVVAGQGVRLGAI